MPAPELSRRGFIALTGSAAALPAVVGRPTPASADTPARPPSAHPVRPPAVPLAVRSPYLSTWLAADALPGVWPTFWNGHITAMTGLARIDGVAYTFLGAPALPDTPPLPTMRQTDLALTPTRSVFTLEQAGVRLRVEFLSPVEPGDPRRQSIPFSYVSARASSADGRPHRVSLYFDISGEWAHGDTNTRITWAATQTGALLSLTSTPAAPAVLAENNESAAWGTVVWSTALTPATTYQIGQDAVVRSLGARTGALANTVDTGFRAINDRWPVFAFNTDLGQVTARPSQEVVLSIGHVREPAVSYLGTDLPPLWRSHFPGWPDMVAFLHADHRAATARADRLDARLTRDAVAAGGERYAALCALALRQAYAGTELVSRDGVPWAFLKEISSNGNMSTVDVIYPAMPVFGYLDPGYLALLLAPLLDYAERGGWPKRFAEHDLGTHYPRASGHNDGQEEDMPVEESANLLIMSAAYAQRGGAAREFATAHYPILTQWADYLVENALDPEFQNQTDDFTGFIGHSVNLALKGIVGIGAMSVLATAAGNQADATRYLSAARSYIARWAGMAADGPHLRLAYDQPGTWSQKYNGFADALLNLGLVPRAVAASEAAWYLSRANTYGVPLDIRHTYTKADWELWTAAWLRHEPRISDLLIESIHTFLTTTASRVPFTDWYDTVTDRQTGFQARPVVGATFALLAVRS
jgi:Glutaminase A six helical-hairpin domain/Domain of unknown function (DUF5127)/Domain of unknown function (DUF4964)